MSCFADEIMRFKFIASGAKHSIPLLTTDAKLYCSRVLSGVTAGSGKDNSADSDVSDIRRVASSIVGLVFGSSTNVNLERAPNTNGPSTEDSA